MTSSDSGDDRATLEGELGEILGFHDVSDVFDHLTQFSESEDLMGYLTDLLGPQTANTDRVRGFADNLARFVRGEPIVVVAAAGDGGSGAVVDDGQKKPPPSKVAITGGTGANVVGGGHADGNAPPEAKQPQKGNKAEKDGEPEEGTVKKKHDESARKVTSSAPGKKAPPPRQKTPPRKAPQKHKQPQKQHRPQSKGQPASSSSTATTSTARSEAAVAKSDPVKKEPRPPPRGKATVVCGCWGTVHECLTNCLHCGRIACSEEGYGYCAYCGFLIEKVEVPSGVSGGGEVDSATMHKERLLKFDREFARRTVVLDDQEDYYDSGGGSSWLNEDERRGAELADEEARREKHERKAPKLNIAF